MRRASSVVLAALAASLLPAAAGHPPAAAAPAQPDIVVIVTDDQRWDTVGGMPIVERELAGKGTTFANAFVVNPKCCPSRASILTGQYSHSTGVWTNRPPHGGFEVFDDDDTVAVRLEGAGYETALIGKYMNGYNGDPALGGYVPPGWSRWVGVASAGYLNYRLSVDGSIVRYGDDDRDYSTDVLADHAASFIRKARGPLFLLFTPRAPHAPFTPAARHRDAAVTLPPRSEAFDEANVRDKPRWVRRLPRLDKATERGIDRRARAQMRTLLSADDAVGTILDALRDTGRLHETLIVFTSDNGLAWGEHRWKSKSAPYEESIRVPLIVRYDPVTRRTARVERRLATLIDLAPTAVDLAGASSAGMEGASLVPILDGGGHPWRSSFVVEQKAARPPAYCAVRTRRWSYVYYETGEEELYDLRRDPAQLRSLDGDRDRRARRRSLRAQATELCDPAPPGVTFPARFRA